MLSDDEIQKLGGGYCSSLHFAGPHNESLSSRYTFNEATLLQFARAIERKVIERFERIGWGVIGSTGHARAKRIAELRAMLEDKG